MIEEYEDYHEPYQEQYYKTYKSNHEIILFYDRDLTKAPFLILYLKFHKLDSFLV